MREMNPTAIAALNTRIQNLEAEKRRLESRLQSMFAVEEKLRVKVRELEEKLTATR